VDEEDKKKIEGLISALRMPNFDKYMQQIRSIKWDAVNELYKLAREAVEKEDWEAIEYLLKHDHFNAKGSAIGVLGAAANNGKDIQPVVSTLIDKLMESLKDQRIETVRNIIDILEIIGEHTSVLQTVPHLISILGGRGKSQRENAAITLHRIAENRADRGDYASALKIIKDATTTMMKFYSIKDRYSLTQRRQELSRWDSLAQKIHDKMNSIDMDKKFHVPHQTVKTVRKKVRTNG